MLRFNAEAACEQYAELADVIPGINSQGGALQKTHQLIHYLEALITRLNLPTRLRDRDIDQKDLPMLASDAMLQQRLLINNPRAVSETDALAIYQAAY
ncbi:hypothetical protein [Oceanicoccus sagamiensis]|uniref:hypothetical protein n=1 Tax=Oceanicoccus sagamiensis TaxID=716816 RepID=UPI0026D0422C